MNSAREINFEDRILELEIKNKIKETTFHVSLTSVESN